jgi:hypothetical protein
VSCTPDALVCNDNPEPAMDLGLVVAQVGVVLVLLVLVVLLGARLLRRPRSRRAPVTRVRVSADGDVVRRSSG